jgi:membrane-bound serine protease (ClpP class)
LNVAGAEVRQAGETWAENVVRFLTDPVISSLLMTIGLLGIVIEIRTPGFGFPGALGIASLALFLWGHYLARLAGWEVLLLLGSDSRSWARDLHRARLWRHRCWESALSGGLD